MAFLVDVDLVCALESHSDYIWVCARSNDKVEFQLALVAVEDQVNTGIDFFVAHLTVVRNIFPPLSSAPQSQAAYLEHEDLHYSDRH